VIALNWAFRAVGVDAHTADAAFADATTSARARAIAQHYVNELYAAATSDAAALRARFSRAAVLFGELERWQLDCALAKIAAAEQESLDEQAARVIERHYRYAGNHHHAVAVDGRSLVDIFAAPSFDARAFLQTLKRSKYLTPNSRGECRFLSALKFGGSM